MDTEMIKLTTIAQNIAQVARGMGLDFYPVNFEIVPAEALYTFGAYGMPVRFAHWSFGKAFYRMKTQYDLNLSRIYELVINTNPAYAFLLEGNHLTQNKLVIGHVYAHVDFFKNNHYFSHTPKDMVERMAAHAEKIREYEGLYGREKVESTLDAVLAIQEHVDFRSHIGPDYKKDKTPNNPLKNKQTEGAHSCQGSGCQGQGCSTKGTCGSCGNCRQPNVSTRDPNKAAVRTLRNSTPYEDLWEDLSAKEHEMQPKQDYEDLLYYLIEFSPGLEEWQRDIVSIVREESLYFFPQIETKIINEGWATFWHAKIMRELELTENEALEFSLMHSQVVQPSRMGLNPYYLGVKIWESLAKKKSLEELFELRETENDLSFIRNHLSKELVEELNLFNFRKVGAHWQVTDIDWEKVRDNLVMQLVNGGNPRIVVQEGDYEGKGGLYLKHCHEGVDLDVVYLEKTLTLVQFLWGKSAALETVVDGKPYIFEVSDGLVSRRQKNKADNN
ncbi:SpoVR family protein [Desulfosporosinus sp. SYSU MS00001]|uniref:SpoVR family protein n=1 Tax=Desulfosporosinus sp. SYSU MS00001 TaxID=3416284 RepID=UPI003CEA148B